MWSTDTVITKNSSYSHKDKHPPAQALEQKAFSTVLLGPGPVLPLFPFFPADPLSFPTTFQAHSFGAHSNFERGRKEEEEGIQSAQMHSRAVFTDWNPHRSSSGLGSTTISEVKEVSPILIL